MAHYDGTAQEIWDECGGQIDMLCSAAGTGGTITGVGRRLKELNPNIIIVGIDPIGSILAQPEELNTNGVSSYKVRTPETMVYASSPY
jgi:cystathionine beta-synthase